MSMVTSRLMSLAMVLGIGFLLLVSLIASATRAAIRRLVERIAARFQPDQIILFGSYAYGEPDPDSDVDLLVVMPASREVSKSIRILNAVDPPFSVDLIVRTPKRLSWRLEEGDWFLREVVDKGKVMYEKTNAGVAPQGRRGPSRRKQDSQREAAAT